MGTTVHFDFLTGLPEGARPPRVALADVYELAADGELGTRVAEDVVVNLKPRKGAPAAEVTVRPGAFFVRLRTPEGRVLTQRVRVESGRDNSLVFLPQPPEPEPEPEVAFGSVVMARERLPRELAPVLSDLKPAVPREWWSAFAVDHSEGQVTLSNIPGLHAVELVERKHDFMGVARLQSGPRDAHAAPGYLQMDLTERLVGDIAAAQVGKVYGNKGEGFARWKAPVRNRELAGATSSEGKGKRYYALSYRAENTMDPVQVACIPGRWEMREGGHADVYTNFYERQIGNASMQALRVEVDDPDLGGLLDFLQQGDRSGSTRMLRNAKELLYRKWVNPYASAAAGYVLIQAGEWHGPHVDWTQWVLNLAHRYSGLPDGAILFTTLLLQSRSDALNSLKYEDPNRNPFRSAPRAALEAIRRGPPLYRHGLKLMATNLAILQNEARRSPGSDVALAELEAASDYVRELSMRVDPEQPFCVFDVRGY